MAEKLFSYADKQVMEEVGSGGGGSGYSPLFIHPDVVEGSIVFDKTWKEVHDHFINGGTAFVVFPDAPGESLGEVLMVVGAACYLNGDDPANYVIICRGMQFITTTENGYPAN